MKWLRLGLFAALLIALPLIVSWGWEAYRGMGRAIPGTSAFRAYFDSAHGMATISGTFDLNSKDNITVSCWSPGIITRTQNFDINLQYSGYPGWPKPGQSGVQSVKVKAGDFSASFDAALCYYSLWINPVTREQLRQISKAHEAVFDVGKGKTLTLNEGQLAQIQALIAYTDGLPTDYHYIKAMTRAIGEIFSQYAQDHHGKYPVGKSSTDIFQQLIDQDYLDAKMVYFPMQGKTEATTTKLKPENVCYDVTNAVLSDDSDALPVVFMTGYKLNYVKGGIAHPLANGDANGMVLCSKGIIADFVQAATNVKGISAISANFDPKGRTYVQLTPSGPLP
jgi:hypothetical protein